MARKISNVAGELALWLKGSFQRVSLGEKVKKVSLGLDHGAAVGESGTLYTFGRNDYGQLGHGDKKEVGALQMQPVNQFLKAGVKVKSVECGHKLTLVHTDRDQVYAMGLLSPKSYFPFADTRFTRILPFKIQLPEEERAEQLAVGDNCFAILTQKGNVYNMGANEYRSFGSGNSKISYGTPLLNEVLSHDATDPTQSISKIVLCKYSGAVIKAGCMFVWGESSAGHLGIIDEGRDLHSFVSNPEYVPLPEQTTVADIVLSEEQMFIFAKSGTLYRLGCKLFLLPTKVDTQEQIVCLDASGHYFAFLNDKNQIFESNGYFKINPKIPNKFIYKNTDLIPSDIDKKVIWFGGKYDTKYFLLD